MFENSILSVVLLAAAAIIVLLLALLLRKPDAALAPVRKTLEDALREEQRSGRAELRDCLETLSRTQMAEMERFGQRLAAFGQQHETRFGQLSESLDDKARQARHESSESQRHHNEALGRRIHDLTERTDKRLDEFRAAIGVEVQRVRRETEEQQQRFTDALGLRLKELTDRNARSIDELRVQVETQLRSMQLDNAQKLEQMRATVDEKLQSTLETRLGESFRLVSERLEAVQRGLGEMQQLASGVGDLKRVLTNVKTRGTFGETQLGALLEQVLTLEQYAANIATVPGSGERVEYAVRLPGGGDGGAIWLPIDAKFPHEDYERLLDAQERADAAAMQEYGNALERRIKDEAKKIREKYVAPPATTDFALLFLPTEGLYAEVIRRPGLFDGVQREHRVTLVGPTTLLALLNSLQMGFRTLAIEKRSSEVWQTLGAVKDEFGKFATVLEKAHSQLDTVQNSIKKAGVRTRAIERKLRGVETLPSEAARYLPDTDEDSV
ncbi:DNA recombination protein RmuC [Lysobacter pythonis]|uniref:DNA recombination protein RmuC n=1 Tax=Solilutibacter pythonis TaxID=2483112 RepID=A0A3M2HXX0_9GAMM|nr:DNA recombination protein RmuC [Lysobacter pythonis]RMH93898.1 DNA recombination protein RmuC [Lysobacter pythonis]